MFSEAQSLTSPDQQDQSSIRIRAARASAAVSRTSRSLPERPNPSAARGKGGCWTCRVRRKKCDEQRENGSCQTCLRLKIECLGWGARRPDWMRDKAQVEAYKAGVKRRLCSQGMVRGQPRTAAMSTGANTSPMQYQYPVTSRHLPVMTGDSDEGDEYASDHDSADASSSHPIIQIPQPAKDLDLNVHSTPGTHTPPIFPSYNNSPHSTNTRNLPILPFSVPSQYSAGPARQGT